ncbi:hypothetical protein HWV62_37390 [Athelia sp. TMB]|nr:hypothetical protein HWV62_37390 [Athelia sp. TMB]
MAACLVVHKCPVQEALPKDTVVARETTEKFIQAERNEAYKLPDIAPIVQAVSKQAKGFLSSIFSRETADDWVSASPLDSVVARDTLEEFLEAQLNTVYGEASIIESRAPAKASEDLLGGLLSSILGCETADDWSMPKPTVSCDADNIERFKYHCANDKDAKDPATMAACLIVVRHDSDIPNTGSDHDALFLQHQCPVQEALPKDTSSVVAQDTLKRAIKDQLN